MDKRFQVEGTYKTHSVDPFWPGLHGNYVEDLFPNAALTDVLALLLVDPCHAPILSPVTVAVFGV